MRDIRDELRERIEMLEVQMHGVLDQFEAQVEQLKQQRDKKISELRTDLETLNRAMHMEHRHYGPTKQPQQGAVVTELRRAV